jgi:hypothetical protein
MAQGFTLPTEWSDEVAVAAPYMASDVAGLRLLPSEWQVVDRVVLNDSIIDHAIVGPNGLFTVSIDPDRAPATVEHDGLYRSGVRVTHAVKSALGAASDLRSRVGSNVFAYPLLVTPVTGDRSHLDRLGVVPGDRIAEAIWTHPGRPMRRSERLEVMWALRSLAS